MFGLLVRFARTAQERGTTLPNQIDDDDKNNPSIDMCPLEARVMLSASPMAGGETPDEVQQEGELVNEDYSAATDIHDVQAGDWAVVDGHYQVNPDGDGVSTLLLDELPSDLELLVDFNADDTSPDHLSNAFVIFDYHSDTDFKFAGAFVGGDRWVIGHRTEDAWVTDTQLDAPIDALTDYHIHLDIINDSQVTLYANGSPQLTHTFDSSVTDGHLGLGSKDAVVRFDNLQVRALTLDTGGEPGSLSLSEDFDDHVAENLDPVSGSWLLVNGGYRVVPDEASDGFSHVMLNDHLPDHVEIGVSISAGERYLDRFSNGAIIFDYHSPTDFKYAGAFMYRNEWAIGQRTADGWMDQAVISSPLEASTEYNVHLVIENGTDVSLYDGDTMLGSHSFDESVTDGDIGLGSKNSITQFDNLEVIDLTPAESQIIAELHGKDLFISGETSGEVEIAALDKSTFAIYEYGQLVTTVEGVRGDLNIDFGDSDDIVTLDLGDLRFRHDVNVNLGGGDNSFDVINGSIRGRLNFVGGDGSDSVRIADDVSVRGRSTVDTGAGDDSIDVAGDFRSLHLKSGDGIDTVGFSGDTNSLYVGAGDGNDTVDVSGEAHNVKIRAGEGDDTVDVSGEAHHLHIRAGEGDDLVDVSGEAHHLRIRAGDDNDIVNVSGEAHSLHVVTDDGDDAANVSGHAHTLHVRSGDGDDQIELSGDVGRTAHVNSGNGDDSLIVLGDVNLLFANMGNGTDNVDVLSDGNVRGLLYLGRGDDTFEGRTHHRLLVLGGRGHDSVVWTPGT